MDPDKTLVDWAERDLQCFGAVSREEAAVALEMWSPMRKLRERSVDAAAEVTALVLSRFPAAEPPAVPGMDWLAEAKADADAIVASLREPAPVKDLPAVEAGIPASAYHPFTQGAFPGVCSVCCEGRDGKLHVAETVAALDEPRFCTDVYVGNEGEFKCDRFAGHGDHHWHLLAEFGWPVALVEVVPHSTAEAVQCGFAVCDKPAAEGDKYCTPHRNEHDSAMRGARAWDRAMGS